MLKAVIFDMDGVIIDSEPLHARAAVLALEEFGADASIAYVQQFIGSTVYYMSERMVEDFYLNISPQVLLDTINAKKELLKQKEGYAIIPYIIEVIKDLHQNGMKLIIASSSQSEAIEMIMDSYQLKKYFEGYVSGCMVTRPKPAPDIFLLAAERLGVLPEECLVIEDSCNGVTAAGAAGMTCLGYVNPNSGNQDLRKAAMLIEGFDEVDYSFINKVYQYDRHEPAAVLTTGKFIIRELSLEDMDDLFEICRDPDIRDALLDFSDSPDILREKHSAYIENVYRYYGYGSWGVYLRSTNRLIGRCGVEYRMLLGEAVHELGYYLDKAHRGHGYAEEFVAEVIRYCLLKLDIPRIIAVIHKSNNRSLRLAEKVGMHRYGECIRNNHSCYLYEIKR